MVVAKKLSFLSGLCALALLGGLAWGLASHISQQRHLEAREIAQVFSLRLLERLSESMGAVYLLSKAVDRRTGAISNFDDQAADLLRDFPLLRALELAPGGVINHVYPLRGNEIVLGHDLLLDKTRNREVHQAVMRRQMALSGPFELRQGGVGIVARYPIYLASTDSRSRFWGLSIIVIDFPSLIIAAGKSEFDRLGYRYQICWIKDDYDCKQAIGDADLSPDDALVSMIRTGYADWRLLVQPVRGWLSAFEYGLLVMAVVLGAGFAAWFFPRFYSR